MKNNIFFDTNLDKSNIFNDIHSSYTKHRLVLFVLMTALGLAGCGDKDSSGDSIVTSSFDGAAGNCANGGIRIDVFHNGKIQSDQTQFVCNGNNGINGSNGMNGSDGLNGENGINANIQTSAFEGEQGSCMHGGVKVEVLLDGVVLEDQTQYICNGAAGQDGIEGQAGQNGHNALAVSSDEVDENCANGGLRIDFGLDANDNDTLDDDEILASRYVCNGVAGEDGLVGQNGHNALAASSDEVGENCANGGIRVDVGLDSNDNGTLDDDEILAARYVCNGVDGEDGQAGQNGHNALAASSDEVGENCANGGTRLDFGLDANDNDTLDADEILSSRYICNGEDGENSGKISSIQTSTFEGEQGSCTNGGVKVEVLIDGEVQADQTQYICNGANGADGKDGKDGHDGQNGHNTLVATSNEVGSNCANGGIRLDVGLDSNDNGTLDAGEVLNTRHICNGTNGTDGKDGKNASIQTTPFKGAQGSCTNGGVKVEVLIDGVIQKGQTQYICNGVDGHDGHDGQNGHNALVATSDADNAHCANGGIRVDSGLDTNGNDVLDAAEILSTHYVCNGGDGEDGTDGKNASIQTTAFEGTQGSCTNGGVKIEVLIDGVVQAGQTQYICNGVDGHDGHDGQNGHNALVATSDAGNAHCTNGGIRVDSGLDTNGNNELDAAEILSTRYVCNGADGEDGTDGKNASIQTIAFEGAQGSCTNGGVKIEVLIGGVVQADQTQYVCNGENGTNGQTNQNTCPMFQGQCIDDDNMLIVGDIVTFGRYPQATNTPEPISWSVRSITPKSDNSDGKILLLSLYVLDARSFSGTTWAESGIRTWLNDASEGFLSTAFNAEELNSIVDVTNSTEDYSYSDFIAGNSFHDGGPDTTDKVFLLRRSDVPSALSKAKATRYAMQQGVTFNQNEGTEGTCANIQCSANWRLRSPGCDSSMAWVSYVGAINYECSKANINSSYYSSTGMASSTKGGVRPALWVKY